MSRTQNNAVALARNVIDSGTTQVQPAEMSLLVQASGITNNQTVEVLAHRVLRDYAQGKGYFAQGQYVA
jgi:hypothetical protein